MRAAMISEPVKSGHAISLRGGFTMIELMVVVAIIVLASGIMGPTIADFMKNRELEGVRGQFGKILNRARLLAVNQRRDFSVVFFREGPRVFDELAKRFEDESVWFPENSALREDPLKVGRPENPAMWYALGFAGGASSYDKDREGVVVKARKDRKRTIPRSIPSFEDWDKDPRSAFVVERKTRASGRSTKRSSGRSSSAGRKRDKRYRTTNLYKVTFNRSGTMVFSDGCSDVPTSIFNNETVDGRPRTADVVILQYDATSACFIDLRPTGQLRSKVRPLSEAPLKSGDVSSIRGGEKEPVRSGRS